MVLHELNAILASHHFKNSKRYPALLRYVVDKAVDGQAHQLKERTLGVEVFDRSPDYDTNADPIVRFSASEVRKRIAQFYHETGPGSSLQIDLPLGSYVPEFTLRKDPLDTRVDAIPGRSSADLHDLPDLPSLPEAAPHNPAAASHRVPARFTVRAYLLAAAVLLTIAGLGIYLHRQASAVTLTEQLWKPLLKAPGPVLVVIGNGPRDLRYLSATPGENLTLQVHGPYDHVSFSEAVALSHLGDVLTAHAKPYAIKEADLTTVQDIRDRSVILIGAYNNLWTMRLMEPLRFSFRKEGLHVRIIDSKNPENQDWVVDYTKPYAATLFDYAIVARYADPTTSGSVLIIAGIGAYGTEAASQSIATPRDIEKILIGLPRGWENKNVELVIRTAIINGQPGPPSLIEYTTW